VVVWTFATSTLAAIVLLVLPSAMGLWAARSSLDTVPLDLTLLDLSACVVLGCAAWAWVAVSATVAEAWHGAGSAQGTAPPRLWHLPAGAHRLVLAACGFALVPAVTIPAHAAGGADLGHAPGVDLLSGLPLPDRAVAPRAPTPSAGPAGPLEPAGTGTRTVTVQRGDTLWSIAVRDLPAGAPDRAVATRWRAIYDVNRPQIGPDPDLIRPGQRLRLPRKERP
jgi:nucleoid-associated protein YgaU